MVHQSRRGIVSWFDIPWENEPSQDHDPKVNPNKEDEDHARETDKKKCDSGISWVILDEVPDGNKDSHQGEQHESGDNTEVDEVSEGDEALSNLGGATGAKTGIRFTVVGDGFDQLRFWSVIHIIIIIIQEERLFVFIFALLVVLIGATTG